MSRKGGGETAGKRPVSVTVMLSVAALLAVWVVAGPFGLYKLHRLKGERRALYQKGIQLSEMNAMLEREIRALKQDEAVQEAEVRKRLGWVRDGELLYRFMDEER